MLRGEIINLMINCAPGTGKSELCKHLVARILAENPAAAIMYISYSHDLAANHTHGVKQIIELPAYRKLFGVEIAKDSKAKDSFQTAAGGKVTAFGSSGGITGRDAGLMDLESEALTGILIMDDMHKPDEVHSDNLRNKVWRNYLETIIPRRRSPKVPFFFIGQALHEDDLRAHILNGDDGLKWEKTILKAEDTHGNILCPHLHSREFLTNMKNLNPYTYASQYLQDPIPAGGALFKKEYFILHKEEPQMLGTFITCDTAETDKTYNDATVFSFWGVYKIKHAEYETDMHGLHLIDCLKTHVEPKDLLPTFMDFYAGCMRHKVKPKATFIEKKSTGVTLLSILNNMQGLNIIDVPRTGHLNGRINSKVNRFLEMQPFLAKKLVSLPFYSNFTDFVIQEALSITANNTHRHDDVIDTMYDAVRAALIDKTVFGQIQSNSQDTQTAQVVMSTFQQTLVARKNAYARR
jgi:predicted phage terminase large subunit-like protein